ncbi:MAG: hypothetical protein GY699_10910 [Desulfobacteraceae bacterium]|nr:hypothetical protein [Desulfobacteraceae bacterium]
MKFLKDSCARICLTLIMILMIFLTNAAASKDNIKGLNDIKKQFSLQDNLTDLLETFRPPTSDWIESEKQLYRILLNKKKYDVLLVPFQNIKNAIDLTSRKLMSYRLMHEMEKQTNMTIAPVHLIYRVLGNTARIYNEKEVYDLASKLGVKHIIWCFSGYTLDKKEKKHKFKFSIIDQKYNSFPNESQSREKSWKALPIDLKRLPFDAFLSNLSQVIDFLGFPPVKNSEAELILPYMATDTLPLKPIDLVKEKNDSALINAYKMQLMGLLVPTFCTLETQNDFFIRSMTYLWKINKTSPDYKLLLSRAYLYLDRRPKALNTLGEAVFPEEKAFQEHMNTNLSKQQDYIRQIGSPLKKLMAQLEYYHIKFDLDGTDIKSKIKALLGSIDKEWHYLVRQKLIDHDSWSLQSNIELKTVLDNDYPIDGVTMETLLKSSITVGDFEDKRLNFEMLFADHISKVLQSENDIFSSNHSVAAPNDYDYLLLMKAIGESNLLKSVIFYLHIQRSPKKALHLVNSYLSIFQGHPAFHINKMEVLNSIYKQSKNWTAREKKDLVKKIIDNSLMGWFWYGQHDKEMVSCFAEQLLKYYVKRNPKLRVDLTGKNFPADQIYKYSRGEFLFCQRVRQVHLWFDPKEKMKYIHTNIKSYEKIVKGMLKKSKSDVEDLLDNENRFKGVPTWGLKKAAIFKKMKRIDKANKIYENGIKENPDFWENYHLLGDGFVKQGKYKAAKDLFIKYPPFTQENPKTNTVQLSNESYDAGSLFFWQGEYDMARIFYEISADLSTGSGASLSSQIRLSLMAKDFITASRYAMRAAKRYNNEYRYQEYMSLLHIQGLSDNAWPLFDSLIGRFSAPEIWTSSFIGHRINNTSDDELIKWIKDKRKLTNQSNFFPLDFGMVLLTDRVPNISFAKAMGELEMNSLSHVKEEQKNMTVILPTASTGDYGPLLSWKEAKKLSKETFQFKKYQYMVEAYMYLKQKKYKKSYQAFKKYSLIMVTPFVYGEMIPYLTFSAIKSENSHVLKNILNLDVVSDDFDQLLSHAVLKGLNKKYDESLDLFNKAFYNIPLKEKRFFFPWYQIVELMEWMYLDTGEKRYIEQAMEWSKQYQTIQPMFAWAYAFEAKYTQDPEKQIIALAYAQYLDRDSFWISEFSSEKKVKARAWFELYSFFKIEGELIEKI